MKLKKLISGALAAVMLTGTAIVTTPVKANTASLPFEDVEASAWYYGAVDSAYAEGIMKGKTNTSFDPTANITRAEVVTAFARIACVNIEGYGEKLTFTDTVKDSWYSDSVGWAAENGIVKGRGDGRFSPSDLITRQEIASIIMNFLSYMEINAKDNAKIDSFADKDSFASWAAPVIESVRKTGLMQGKNGGRFAPTDNATRAEIATVATNIIPMAGRVSLVENGTSDYVIVAGNGYTEAAERLRYQIESTTGARLEIVKSSSSDKVICLGGTSLKTNGLGSNGYEVKADGNKVLVDGETPEGVYRGAVRFALSAVSGDDARFTPKTSERMSAEYPVKSLKINGNDISKYTVYYPEGASDKTVLGANEIVKYVKMACGAELKTSTSSPADFAIIVEEKSVDVKGQFDNLDNFSVKSEGNSIRITGSAVRGAMYGCYDFLEKCVGCRFLWVDVDYVRPADEIDIKDVSYSEMPVSIARYQYNLTSELQNKFRNLYIGEHLKIVGQSIHSFDYYDEDFSSQFTNQPCLTSEEVYKTILKNVRAELAKAENPQMISLSVNDNDYYCTCDSCKASDEKYGAQSGTLLAFVNKVAEELEDEYPDVYIHTFAYLYTKKPPVGIKAHKNVVVQMCTDNACCEHDYTDSCIGNREIKEMIEGWNDVAELTYEWDYRNENHFIYTDIANGKILSDFRAFADCGSLGVFMQSASESQGGFYELRCYLISKVLWDPYMSEEEYQSHIDDFLVGYYGEGAAELIRRSIETVEGKKLKACYGVTYSTFKNDVNSYFIVSQMLKDVATEALELTKDAMLLTESSSEFAHAEIAQVPYIACVLDNKYLKYGKGDPALDAVLEAESRALQNIFQKYGLTCHSFGVPNIEKFTKSPCRWKILIVEQMGL